MQSHILTVTKLSHQIKDLMEGAFPDIWVEGEISNLTVPQSGHAYFTLKDEHSQVRAVLFRSSQRHLKFTLQHGMLVVCRGRVGVYEPRGEYQLILEYVEPKGIGALQRAFEELKSRLEKEGLFALGRKRALPVLPRRVGVITSPTGAAIRDILRVIRRRHPRMEIVIYPVPVQGSEAPPEIIQAIEHFNRTQAVDVLIIGRGGGSLEDLWAFNEEAVARAIMSSRIPVISAVGHETDYTIADFVADVRAPTPSAAAEMVVESEENLRATLGSLQSRLYVSMRAELDRLRSALSSSVRLLGDPRRQVQQLLLRTDELRQRLALAFRTLVIRDRGRLAGLSRALDQLNPLGILGRGYSITRVMPAGMIVKNAAELKQGDVIRTRLLSGEVDSRVEKTLLP
ncbi:MAG: exodeoxyribonuclease VII large subunit [Nitrospirota bacterium]|nr:exodeoxyribonuclease VII large subunit [Nitrospirota bacterium]